MRPASKAFTLGRLFPQVLHRSLQHIAPHCRSWEPDDKIRSEVTLSRSASFVTAMVL